jgi:CRP-like cAMP-binding protein
MVNRRRTPVEPVQIHPYQCTPFEQRRLLGGMPVFAQLTDGELDNITSSFRQDDFAAGSVIHRAGEPATRLSVIAAGMVKLVRPTLDGQDVLLDIYGPGEHFGSLAELGDLTYREDAYAHTDCCVLSTTANEFRDLLRRFPAVAVAALDQVAVRLREAQETIEQISAYPVDRRIAAVLVDLARRVGREEAGALLIEMPLSRQDLADMTGAKVETVSRVISDFRRKGLIESGRRWIAVRDAERLADIAYGT